MVAIGLESSAVGKIVGIMVGWVAALLLLQPQPVRRTAESASTSNAVLNFFMEFPPYKLVQR